MLTIDQIQDAWERSAPIELGDPMLARFCTPIRQTFYPLGFPVRIETNREEVLHCAAANWQGFDKLFDIEPMVIRVAVRKTEATECPPAPFPRIQQHLATNVADGDNYSVTDLHRRYSSIWLTEAALAHRSYVSYFFLESAAMTLVSTSFTTAVHAACVELNGCGILLCGDSGAGKTSLAYACARNGWTYISDDGSYLVNNRDDRLVVGNCKQARFRSTATNLFPELQGRNTMKRAQAGKPSIELEIQSRRDIVTSFTSRINHVVFLNRRNVHRQELTRFPTEVARYSMLQVLYSPPEIRQRQVAMIDHLLDDGAHELRYSHLDWAVERLVHLAERGS
jgi:hypothetical protein